MMVVEYNKIELDYCFNCKGVWFDSGELELLLNIFKREDHKSLVRNFIAFAEKIRKCPICHQRMNKSEMV